MKSQAEDQGAYLRANGVMPSGYSHVASGKECHPRAGRRNERWKTFSLKYSRITHSQRPQVPKLWTRHPPVARQGFETLSLQNTELPTRYFR